ncbi:MAG: response regulator [Myxococcaceae bacterium]
MAEAAPIKVLVVDDDLELGAMIARYLGGHGYKTFTAPNALEALALLEREHIDLLITDLMMPHLDGIHFAEKVHAMPRYKGLSVILMTAYPSDEIIDKGMRKGVALTLSKPIELSKLLDLVGFATH